MDGKYQNDIQELPTLDKDRYENLFRIYNVTDAPNNFYYYNITKNVKIDPDDVDDAYIIKFTADRDIPWTTLSYGLYGSIYLWWLVKLLNPDTDPFIVESGTTLKVIRPEFVEQVLNVISQQVSV